MSIPLNRRSNGIFSPPYTAAFPAELAQFADYWAAFDGLQTALFTDNGTPYVQPKTDNLKAAMQKPLAC